MTGLPEPEFSRPVAVDALAPGESIARRIEADAAERAALCERLDLISLDSLAADIELRRLGRGGLILAEGRIEADIVQRCVATLGPVPAHVGESFEERYAPEDYEPPEEQEDDDLPEPFDGHEIDIGELATQILSLAMNPWPRAPDAPPEPLLAGESGESGKRRPFEGLAEMLKKPD